MLDRIYLDNNETSSYPLSNPSKIYPQGLVTDVSIMVDDTISSVCIYSITVTQSGVYVIFTGRREGSLVNIGYSNWNKSGMAVSGIISQATGKCIGWVSLGTIAQYPGSYVGEEKLDSGCVIRSGSSDARCVFNGVTYDTPEMLDIMISGDIDYTDNGVSVVVDNFPEGLDSDHPSDNGSIVSINGETSSGQGSLVIKLPTDDSGDPLFSVDVLYKDGITREDPRKFTVITIDNKYDDRSKYHNFTCPDSDILIDSLMINKYEVKYHETPLDSYVEWYRSNKENNSTTVDNK